MGSSFPSSLSLPRSLSGSHHSSESDPIRFIAFVARLGLAFIIYGGKEGRAQGGRRLCVKVLSSVPDSPKELFHPFLLSSFFTSSLCLLFLSFAEPALNVGRPWTLIRNAAAAAALFQARSKFHRLQQRQKAVRRRRRRPSRPRCHVPSF